MRADTGTCGGASITLPFTDVSGSNIFFCEIAEAYFSGLTNGTSDSTYSPGNNVTREQMAAFVTRTMDQSLKRGSRRAALKRFWTPVSLNDVGLTPVGTLPVSVASDGTDLWVANTTVQAGPQGNESDTVSRVRASDGKLLETWTGATAAGGVLAAKGKIFVTGGTSPAGKLYQIDPTQPAGTVTTLTSTLAAYPLGIAFDGSRIWLTHGGSISIVSLNPVIATTVTGFTNLSGILYDGDNMWVTEQVTNPGLLLKLDSNGGIIQMVNVGGSPGGPVFDGTNIWVPNSNSSTVSVVRASTGVVVATLTGNGLSSPHAAAFDGERILVTHANGVWLWKATDLSPLGARFTISVNQPPPG